MTRPKIEDERAGPPPGGVDLSTVRGMEELDGVFPGKSLDRSRILDTTVELDYRSGTVVLRLSVLGVPETRPPWWEEHCNGLSMSLSYQGDVRIRAESDGTGDDLALRSSADGGVAMVLASRGSRIRVRASACVLRGFKPMLYGSSCYAY
jgi:hypothetical protein